MLPLTSTVEAILRAIGTLEPQETIDSLRETVPPYNPKNPRAQGQREGEFFQLPTNIEGVTAYFNSKNYDIGIVLTVEAILKSIPPSLRN